MSGLHPVSVVVASLRDHPEEWRSDRFGFEIVHESGMTVWIANSIYGMEIKGRHGSWGGDGLLSSLGLSWRHWRLYFACRKFARDAFVSAMLSHRQQGEG